MLPAAGKSLEEIEATAVETTALATSVRAWVARQIAACLQHRTPRESYNTAVRIELAVPDAYHSSAFKAALPRSYKKAMAFLVAEFGSLSYVYDRCPECPFVFRGDFQDREHCPRCCARRYHLTGSHRLAIARLLAMMPS